MFDENINFLKGEKYTIRIIPFEKIQEQVRDYPGLYSWYIRPKPRRESEIIPLVEALLTQKRMVAELQGNLRLEYTGVLEKVYSDFKFDDSDLARQLFVTVPMPLYIGISINLRSRLRTHVDQLLDANVENTIHSPGSIDADTKEESRYFAERVNMVFQEAGVSAVDCLYVRIMEVTEFGPSTSLSRNKKAEVRSNLMQLEYFANTVFNPVMGRR